MAEITVDFPKGDGPCVIAVSGDVDLDSAPDLVEAGLAALESMSGACTDLVIDLAGVAFVDSTGLGAMVAIRNAALEVGETVQVRGVRPRVAKVFRITGLSDVFGI